MSAASTGRASGGRSRARRWAGRIQRGPVARAEALTIVIGAPGRHEMLGSLQDLCRPPCEHKPPGHDESRAEEFYVPIPVVAIATCSGRQPNSEQAVSEEPINVQAQHRWATFLRSNDPSLRRLAE